MTDERPAVASRSLTPGAEATEARARRIGEAWIRRSATRIAERRSWLTELDAAIGDGDHGINLDRGMQALADGLDGRRPGPGPGDLATLLIWAGRTITGTVGGASGALYGRGLLRAGTSLDGDPPGNDPVHRVTMALDAAVTGMAALGRSAEGEKTMLDALMPALRALRSATDAGRDLEDALAAAAEAAEAGAGATQPLRATKGRASYLGERSIGHLDPGAASSAILLRALADVVGSRRQGPAA